jgi:hypothetical protein
MVMVARGTCPIQILALQREGVRIPLFGKRVKAAINGS